jgi:large repetitive protein
MKQLSGNTINGAGLEKSATTNLKTNKPMIPIKCISTEEIRKSRSRFSLKTFLLVIQLLIAVAAFAKIDIKTEDVKCHGEKKGKATITVTGASGNYRYSIDGTNFQASNVFDNLEAKSYTATVRDIDTKCEYTKSFEIKEPSKLNLSVSGGGLFTFCRENGPPTITLTASASGGTPPYKYNWPGGVLKVNSSGMYQAEVTDKNGCKETSTVFVVLIPVICSRDPNDMVGPDGVGPEKWVAKKDDLPYKIRFENDPKFATAAAQVVRINQVLDKNVNIYSLTLGSFGFAGMVFTVPANRTYYTAKLDVVDSLGIIVDVIAGIDVTKNEVFWIFKSLDPKTGLPPEDATKGFLPVNDSITHKGEGFVSYRIKAKNSTVTGDSIYAKANIVFDVNEPILTPQIFNTIDALPPSSTIDSIPLVLDSSYVIGVTANDENGKGSGVATYDLYVAENGGGFSVLAKNIALDSSFTFSGDPGKNYCLYSVAKDSVGNIEPAKTTGFKCFSVSGEPFVKVSKPTEAASYCVKDTVLIQWTQDGVDSLDISYSSNGGTSFTPIAFNLTALDSTYHWVLPDSLPAGNNYVIRLSSSVDSIYDLSGAFEVHNPVSPIITANGKSILCAGDSALLSVTSTYTSYHWSTGATTAAIYVSSAGTYSLTVWDEANCSASSNIVIQVRPLPLKPVLTITGSPTFCQGDSVQLSVANNYDQYIWSNGDSTSSIVLRNMGRYSLRVADSLGCISISSDSVNVVVNPSPDRPGISSNGSNVICQGDSLTLYATSGYTSYLWSTGATTSSIVVKNNGVFSVSATDGSNCVSPVSDSVKIDVLPALTKPTITTGGSTTFCQGDSVLLTASGGYTSYLWSNGSTTPSILVKNSGNFSLSVSDTSGCGFVLSDTVNVLVYPVALQPHVVVNGASTLCQGDSVLLSLSETYNSYLWSNGATTSTILVKTSGAYSVGVVNACGGAVSDTVNILFTPSAVQPLITLSGSSNICNGDSVKLTASAGYTSYLWSTGATSSAIVIKVSGAYFVQGTSTCGTAVSDTVQINVLPIPSQAVIVAGGPTHFCEGGNVLLSSSADYPLYMWSTGETTKSITVQESGIYNLQYIDSIGCLGPLSANTVVVEHSLPEQPVISYTTNVICQGSSVTLYAPAGYAVYKWSTGATTSSIDVSIAGAYAVSVKDTSNCESFPSDSVHIIVLPGGPPPVIVVNGAKTLCVGDSVVLNTASSYLSYLWSTGATTSSITVTNSGSYYVQVSSPSCGSAVSDSVNILFTPTPTAPIITAIGSTTICQGDSLILKASAGYLSYLWSNGASTSSIIVKTTGIYSVKGTSSCGEATSDTVQIIDGPDPVQPIITASGPTTFCTGDSVVFTASSGYDYYLWSNGASTQSIVVKSSGDYYVQGSNKCGRNNSDTLSVLVTPGPGLITISAGGSTTLCAGDSILLSATAGFNSYIWSTGATTSSIWVHGAGVYQVKGTSTCGTATSEALAIYVLPIDKPVITASDSTTFCVGDSVLLSATAGYTTYLWSNGETTSSIYVKNSGTYAVQVTANCGAAVSDSLSINVVPTPEAPEINVTGSTIFCQGDSAILSASAGYVAYLWSTGATTQSITVYSSGFYTVKGFNANGCSNIEISGKDILVTTEPIQPGITVFGSTTFCEGKSLQLKASDGFDSYLWSNGATTQSVFVTTAGIYSVQATSKCGTQWSDPVSVNTIPPPVKPSISVSGSTTFCQGDSVTLSVPDIYLTYLWSDSSETNTITVKETGYYSVNVSNGCGEVISDTLYVLVTPGTSKPVIVASGSTTFCQGDSVTLSVSNMYNSYLWSNGNSTSAITVKTSGLYNVKVTGSCGEATASEVNVTVLPAVPKPVILPLSSTTFCQGDSVVLVTSGVGQLLWSNGATTTSITVKTSGTYTVQQTSSCGSATSDPVTVVVTTQPIKPVISASSTTLCPGDSILLIASSGYTSYLWSTGATTSSIIVKAIGSYNVKGTNKCGTATSSNINIKQGVATPKPLITVTGSTTFCNGGSVTLRVSTQYLSYLWSTGETTRTIIARNTGNYVVEVKGPCGEAVSDTIKVYEYPAGVKPVITLNGSSTFCQGDSVVLISSAGYTSYLWSTGATTSAIVVKTAGVYNVKGITVCDTMLSSKVTIKVNPPTPKPIIAITGSTTFCSGGSVTLKVSTQYGSYLWSNGETTRTIIVRNTGDYVVKVTDACGTMYSDTVKVLEYDPVPKPIITAIGSTSFCLGDSVRLTASSGYDAYLWTTGDTTQSIVVKLGGYYRVEGTTSCGKATSLSAVITVYNPPKKPVITVSGATILCSGATAKLKAPAGYAAYLWSTGETTQNIVVGISGSYSVKVFSGKGCASEAADSVAIKVLTPLNSVNAGADKTIYYLNTIASCATFTAVVSGPTPYQLKWSTGVTTNTLTVCPTASVTYTVTVKDVNGCSVSDDVNACVKPVLCSTGTETKAQICHTQNGQRQTLCVPLADVLMHLNHGDILGPCDDALCTGSPTVTKTTSDDNRDEVYQALMQMKEKHTFSVFPNPFSTTAKIQFSLPETTAAKLQLFDATGKELSILYNAMVESDRVYQVEIDGNNIALVPGIYFCKLSTDDGKVYYQKLVLVK